MKTDLIHTVRIGEQAGIVLFSQWNEFCRVKVVVIGHHDMDSIHDLRVASRRMRATLGLFAPFISGKLLKTLSKKIRRITRELGHVRNIDEAIIYFNSLPTAFPMLAKGLRKAREREITAVIKVLKAFPCQNMDKKLRETVAELAGRSPDDNLDHLLPAYLSETSLQRYQALHDLLASASIPENVEIRHGLRIAIKKWRYLLETIGQVCGQDYGATLETLKEYQTVLGNLNDMVEFGALSDRMTLPAEETKAIRTALDQDTARYLARFIEVASSRPLQYT
jgi:CHAD domain-containing protein